MKIPASKILLQLFRQVKRMDPYILYTIAGILIVLAIATIKKLFNSTDSYADRVVKTSQFVIMVAAVITYLHTVKPHYDNQKLKQDNIFLKRDNNSLKISIKENQELLNQFNNKIDTLKEEKDFFQNQVDILKKELSDLNELAEGIYFDKLSNQIINKYNHEQLFGKPVNTKDFALEFIQELEKQTLKPQEAEYLKSYKEFVIKEFSNQHKIFELFMGNVYLYTQRSKEKYPGLFD